MHFYFATQGLYPNKRRMEQKFWMEIRYFWKPVLWLAIICYGLFIPAEELPVKPFLKIPHFDKLVHFALFFGLCILLIRPLKTIRFRAYLWAPVISILLGALLEAIQHLISVSRSSNLFDFIANTTGILFAVLFYRFLVNGKKWEALF